MSTNQALQTNASNAGDYGQWQNGTSVLGNVSCWPIQQTYCWPEIRYIYQHCSCCHGDSELKDAIKELTKVLKDQLPAPKISREDREKLLSIIGLLGDKEEKS